MRNDRGPARSRGETSADLARAAPWHASLTLGFSGRDGGTVLDRRAHVGPLRVQKPLYPEGPRVCHAVVLHPPGGIAGGDVLDLGIHAAEGAHALLTTPGAGKWYAPANVGASQHVTLDVSSGAVAEWLPQPTIFFDGSKADLDTRVTLAPNACTSAGNASVSGASRPASASRPVASRRERASSVMGGFSGMSAPVTTAIVVARCACGTSRSRPVCATLVVASSAR